MARAVRPSEASADTSAAPIIKSKTGYVVSDKMDKTIVVRVDRLTQHPLYRKRVRKSKKFIAHDENNDAHVGDFVRIAESRPRSKTKSWQLSGILRTRVAPSVVGDEADLEAVTDEAEED